MLWHPRPSILPCILKNLKIILLLLLPNPYSVWLGARSYGYLRSKIAVTNFWFLSSLKLKKGITQNFFLQIMSQVGQKMIEYQIWILESKKKGTGLLKDFEIAQYIVHSYLALFNFSECEKTAKNFKICGWPSRKISWIKRSMCQWSGYTLSHILD